MLLVVDVVASVFDGLSGRFQIIARILLRAFPCVAASSKGKYDEQHAKWNHKTADHSKFLSRVKSEM